MVIPPVINASASPDPGGGPGEQRLSPYITLGGLDMFGEKVPDLATPAECAEELNVEPLKRFTLSVAPLQGVSGPFPNDGANKFLVNCFWKKKEEESKRKREPTRKRKGRSYLCS